VGANLRAHISVFVSSVCTSSGFSSKLDLQFVSRICFLHSFPPAKDTVIESARTKSSTTNQVVKCDSQLVSHNFRPLVARFIVSACEISV